MAAHTVMSVEEYLHTSFEGCDCEYLDGEIVERNMGNAKHGRLQFRIAKLIDQFATALKLTIIPEIRIRISPTRYRIPDVGIWVGEDPGMEIPATPPFLVIEILSPEDRMVRMQPKIGEYLSIGVQWIWVIDPEEKKAICYSQNNPAGSLSDVLHTEDPKIAIPLEKILALQA